MVTKIRCFKVTRIAIETRPNKLEKSIEKCIRIKKES